MANRLGITYLDEPGTTYLRELTRPEGPGVAVNTPTGVIIVQGDERGAVTIMAPFTNDEPMPMSLPASIGVLTAMSSVLARMGVIVGMQIITNPTQEDVEKAQKEAEEAVPGDTPVKEEKKELN